MSDLGDRIRSEADIATRPGQYGRLEAIANEVDRLAARTSTATADATDEVAVEALMRSWGVADDDESAYDSACRDVATVRAALGPATADTGPTWDCVNFTEPATCLSAGVTETARCGRCRLRLLMAQYTVRLAGATADTRLRERVEALHQRVPEDSPFNREGRDVCGTCMDGIYPADWPCPTICALDATATADTDEGEALSWYDTGEAPPSPTNVEIIATANDEGNP
jgi:hypothetical protein